MNTLVISPSAQLYGSERTLLDFLQNVKDNYYVFIPKDGQLISHIKKNYTFSHVVLGFKSSWLKYFYLVVLPLFIIRKNIKVIYANEGAHIRYLTLLSKVFKNRKFVVHLRIKEDLSEHRLRNVDSSMVLLTNSNYMIKHSYLPERIKLIYNLYSFQKKEVVFSINDRKKVTVAVVGRLTITKGVNYLVELLCFLDRQIAYDLDVFMYGKIEKDADSYLKQLDQLAKVKCHFVDFEPDKSKIYDKDIVMHFSGVEPFGRIFLEALDYGCFFIGSTEGGIGEIASILDLEEYMMDYSKEWKVNVLQLINSFSDENVAKKYEASRNKALTYFSSKKYCDQLTNLLN